MSSFSKFFFLLSILFTLHSSATNTLVSDTCKKLAETHPELHYDSCIASFADDDGSATATSLKELGTLSYRVALTRIALIVAKLIGLTRDPKVDRSAVNACGYIYLDANPLVEDGLLALDTGDFATALRKANETTLVPDNCEQKFKNSSSPLTQDNLDFFQSALISYGLVQMLQKV